MASTAVGLQRVSRIMGYQITKGNFQTVSPNLPQSIAIFAEANIANQSNLTGGNLNLQINSAQQAGLIYGFGSPIYTIARILFPQQGGGVSGIPVTVYPQPSANGATTQVFTITPNGVATANVTHTLYIAGRNGLDGQFYNINISSGDNANAINTYIANAINNVLGCPVTANQTTYDVIATSKWAGATAAALSISVNTNGNAAGITYSVTNSQVGVGTPSVQSGLNLFGNQWNTIVVNSYGDDTGTMTLFETFNGIPDPVNPTGRYNAIIVKPFIAITGSVDDNPSTITDSRSTQVTIAIAPAPNSLGLPMEAAANMAILFANIEQNTPQLDVGGNAYPDMPTPTSIGSMAVYDNRDTFVKAGCSTVDLVNGAYVVQDFVTTYHPTGENPPQFRYCRNIMLDLNVYFGYYLLEQINVIDHVIADDADIVSASNVVKPKQWTAIVDGYADQLAQRALIVDPKFMQDSIEVNISTSNPDRLETFFQYKRSGVVRIASTTAQAGFNFGTLTT